MTMKKDPSERRASIELKVGGVVWFAWAVAACSSQVPTGDVRKDVMTDMAGSSGAAGNAGTSSDGGGPGGAGGNGSAGAPAGDGAPDGSLSDASDGASNTSDRATEASGIGDGSEAGETSTRDGAADGGGAEAGLPDAGPGGPTACDVVLNLINREGWVAFDSDRDDYNRNLYMVHPDGSGLIQLTKGANVDRDPFFSFDGTRLSYTSTVAGKPQIFVMDLATQKSVQLTNRPEGAEQSAFSRDNQWVAFNSGVSIYVIRADGTAEKQVATSPYPPGSGYASPDFSADGSELVVGLGGSSIVALKVDNGASRSIVNSTTLHMITPAVSPSGFDVASSIGCRTPANAIWTSPFAAATDACRGDARRVTPEDGFHAAHPTWANDFVLAYDRVDRATNVGAIAMIARADTRPCLVTTGPEDSRNPSWSSHAVNWLESSSLKYRALR
jgi:hypothetical protein